MPNLPASTCVSMTSREIAELTGKEHKNVLRDIDNILKEISPELRRGFNLSTYQEDAPSKYSRAYRKYQLSREAAFTVIAGYSATARAAIFANFDKITIAELIATFDAEDLPPDRFVYVARESKSGRYKVGISKDPSARVKTLNVGNPEYLELIAAYKATEPGHLSETKAHLQLEQHRLRGEWFSSVDGLETN